MPASVQACHRQAATPRGLASRAIPVPSPCRRASMPAIGTLLRYAASLAVPRPSRRARKPANGRLLRYAATLAVPCPCRCASMPAISTLLRYAASLAVPYLCWRASISTLLRYAASLAVPRPSRRACKPANGKLLRYAASLAVPCPCRRASMPAKNKLLCCGSGARRAMPKPACVHACLAREGRRSAKGAASSPLLDARTTTCPSARVPTLPTTTARCRPQTHATNPPPHTADHHRIRRQSRTPREPPHHTCEVLRTTRRGAHPFVDAHTTSHTHPEAPPSLTVPVPARAPQWAARLHPPGLAQPAHAARWAARLPIPALPNLHLLRSGRHGCLSPPGLPCALRQAVTCPLARGRLLTSCLRYRRFGALLRGAARPEPASSHRQPSCPVPPVLACAGLSAPSRASALPPLLLFRCCAPTAAFPLPRPPRLPLRCCAPAAVPPLPSHRCRCLAMAVALPP